MGWDLKFTRPDGTPLGNVESVREGILSVFPEVRFRQEPSGAEKVAAYKARGIELPEVLEQVIAKLPPTIRGDYGAESREFLVEFNLGADEAVRMLRATVKGNNDAAEILLARLAAACGWLMTNFSSRDEI